MLSNKLLMRLCIQRLALCLATRLLNSPSSIITIKNENRGIALSKMLSLFFYAATNCRRTIAAIWLDTKPAVSLMLQLIVNNIKLLIQCGISEAHNDLVRFTNNAKIIPYINIVANEERSSMPHRWSRINHWGKCNRAKAKALTIVAHVIPMVRCNSCKSTPRKNVSSANGEPRIKLNQMANPVGI